MGKINLLSFEVANLIAAGEVVDRPASAVKELLENAIDSGAKHITLEIQRGGVSFIRVADDGCGIEKDDLAPAITRHSTSKIKTAADLTSITTLGFRGEALAAISSVSHIRIYSKLPGSVMGAMLEADGGRIKDITDTGCREGTTVIVEDLFYNVPARRKFLKKDSTEAIAIGAVVEKIALSHPEISFKFISDGEIKFMTSGSGQLKECIWALFGRDTAERSLPVDRSENGIRITGFVSEPDLYRSNRNMENFFINGRYIKSKTASAAIEQAYTSKIPQDKFPFCVLNIELNPAAVDVNVHPAKLEVKFANEKIIFDAVYYAVLSALEAAAIRPELQLQKEQKKSQNTTGYTLSELKNTFVPLDGRQKKPEQITLSDALKNADKPIKSAPAAAKTDSGIFSSQTGTDKSAKLTENGRIQSERTDSHKSGSFFQTQTVRNYQTTASEITQNGTRIPPQNYAETAEKSPDLPHNITDTKAPETPYKLKDMPQKPTVHETAEEKPVNLPLIGNEPKNDPYAAIDSFDPAKIPDYIIIGEAFNCYVIVQIGEILLMIDKHAAHERIIFDELCRKMRARLRGEGQNIHGGQMLLSPIEVNLMATEADAVREYDEKIRALGFDYSFEQNGASSYIAKISAIPDDLDSTAATELFTTLVSRLSDVTASVESAAAGFFENRLWQASCKAAIKGGRIYDTAHLKWICDRLLVTPENGGSVIRTCPHGRPVAFEIKKSSIDRQFARLT